MSNKDHIYLSGSSIKPTRGGDKKLRKVVSRDTGVSPIVKPTEKLKAKVEKELNIITPDNDNSVVLANLVEEKAPKEETLDVEKSGQDEESETKPKVKKQTKRKVKKDTKTY